MRTEAAVKCMAGQQQHLNMNRFMANFSKKYFENIKIAIYSASPLPASWGFCTWAYTFYPPPPPSGP